MLARVLLGLELTGGIAEARPLDEEPCECLGDPSTVLRIALADAESDDDARHARLLNRLEDSSFLDKLDPPTEYRGRGLRADKVVTALAKNSTASARNAFLELTANPVFLSDDDRVSGLVDASVHVAPAPRALVTFWDKYAVPGEGLAHTIVAVLIENGSAPALGLLEKKLVSPAFSTDEKTTWMRTEILSHRNDLPLLRSCDRLLRGRLSSRLRPFLVEALFDYRPDEWYRPAANYSAPPLESASLEALDQMRRIGEFARKNVALTSTQRAAVNLRLKQIDQLRK